MSHRSRLNRDRAKLAAEILAAADQIDPPAVLATVSDGAAAWIDAAAACLPVQDLPHWDPDSNHVLAEQTINGDPLGPYPEG